MSFAAPGVSCRGSEPHLRLVPSVPKRTCDQKTEKSNRDSMVNGMAFNFNLRFQWIMGIKRQSKPVCFPVKQLAYHFNLHQSPSFGVPKPMQEDDQPQPSPRTHLQRVPGARPVVRLGQIAPCRPVGPVAQFSDPGKREPFFGGLDHFSWAATKKERENELGPLNNGDYGRRTTTDWERDPAMWGPQNEPDNN